MQLGGRVCLCEQRRGLEYIFEGWRIEDPLAVYDAGGLEALAASIAKTRGRFGYSTELTSASVLPVLWGTASKNRLDDALAMADGLDKERFPISGSFWGFLSERFEEEGNEEGVN